MKLIKLKTLHMKDPLGIDEKPYFSWMLESDRQNVTQEGYRLSVEDTERHVVWDSGWKDSSENTFIPYEGEKLKNRTGYFWNVEVRDNHGESAKAAAYFETAYPDKIEWKADWAESMLPVTKRSCGFGCQPPATLFRREFKMPAGKKAVRARAYVTARGVYRMYVNGTRIGDSEFAPGYASYDREFGYHTYNLTEYLREGDNAFGMYVGDGWYFSQETAIHKKETEEGHHAVLFEIHVKYEDGTEEVFCSDESLKTAYGPVCFSDLFAGERYDARKEIPGWNLPGYDDSRWEPVKIIPANPKCLFAAVDDRIKVIREITAVKNFIAPNGDHIIDFGQNMAGKVRMHMNLPEGVMASAEYFETLDREGNYYNTILSTNGVGAGADQKVEFVSAGKEQVYEPLFTFLGFRYIRIRFFGLDGETIRKTEIPEVGNCKFTALALSTEKENLGEFECSDPRLNRLYSNIRWSQYSNMISIPTDCPQREKAGWTGDAGIYIDTALLNEDVTPFFTRWMKSVAADQQDDGMIPMVVPFNETYRGMAQMMGQMTMMKGLATSAGWGDAAVKIPWAMYRLTGNREILKEQYGTMKKWCDYIITEAETCGREDLPAERERYLWDTGFHYGEWLIPSTSAAGFDDQAAVAEAMSSTSRYTAPVCGYCSVDTFAKIAGVVGQEEDCRYYTEIAAKMKEAIQSCLIGPDGRPPADYMGAYVLLLYFDLVPEKYKAMYQDTLVRKIRENGGCLDTGFLATPYLLDTLAKAGHTDVAYDLLFQTKTPSWLYEVEKGATTIWETWNAVDESGNPRHVSMNHYSFGCVADWMFRTIGGIRADQPGFRHIVIEPRPDDRIAWARREYLTEQGYVRCRWEKTGLGMKVDVSIPCNTRAVVILPDGSRYETGSGTYTYEC